ncbi:hypothetical protein MAR_021087 [Mya arenaria]|uniref:Ig-like domain-containing protein n=1 Tax=Mya arenaria TaxID=6604 RepID=A0ABY7E6P4_MYAAR|nr:hypothetical protein MAR_021087 [Mya arenaria]
MSLPLPTTSYEKKLDGTLEDTTAIQFVTRNMHGPSTITLSPSTTSYEKKLDDTLGDIICSAICHPECEYTWSKVGTTGTVRTNAILNLGQLTRQEAGSYICTATNPSSSTTRTGPTVVVEVICKSNDLIHSYNIESISF